MNTTLIYIIAGLIAAAIVATAVVRKLKKRAASPPSPSTSTSTAEKPMAKYIQSAKGMFKHPFMTIMAIFGIYLAYSIYTGTSEMWRSITNAFSGIKSFSLGLHFQWWIVVVALVAVGIILDLSFRKKDGEDGSWKKRWEEWRVHFYFAILWTLIVIVLNLGLRHLDVGFWWALWLYKGEGTWFFYLVMALLTVGMWFAVNQEKAALKNCGRIFVILGLVFWAAAWKQNGSAASPSAEKQTVAAAPLPAIPAPAVIVPAPGPSSRWSDKQTFVRDRCEWSPRLSPLAYEADKVPGREVRIDGNDKNVIPWPTSQEKLEVPSYAQFIEIRSTVVAKMTIYGTPKG